MGLNLDDWLDVSSASPSSFADAFIEALNRDPTTDVEGVSSLLTRPSQHVATLMLDLLATQRTSLMMRIQLDAGVASRIQAFALPIEDEHVLIDLYATLIERGRGAVNTYERFLRARGMDAPSFTGPIMDRMEEEMISLIVKPDDRLSAAQKRGIGLHHDMMLRKAQTRFRAVFEHLGWLDDTNPLVSLPLLVTDDDHRRSLCRHMASDRGMREAMIAGAQANGQINIELWGAMLERALAG
jgi:hypothetical protein